MRGLCCSARLTRSFALPLATLITALHVLCAPTPAQEAEPPPERSRIRFHVGWPEGITYEVRQKTPEFQQKGPLEYFEEVYVLGRIGVRVDVDGAVFVADSTLPDFDDGGDVRRAQFYLLGDFRLGLPLAYKFEFSSEGSHVYLNDFYLRWKPGRWVDAVDIGYITPPMGLENVVSSRSLTLMEVSAPVQALAPGYRSGLALAGHWEPWLLAWKAGLYSAGQAQVAGDASNTTAQVVGRLTYLPWRAGDHPNAAFLHLGASVSYAFSGSSHIRYRARPESFIAPFVVDTGDLPAENAFQYALEAAWSDGPVLITGEGLESFVSAAEKRDATMRGAYGLLSWVITGEPHPYNTTTGMFERLQPRHPFSFASCTWGALEVGQRISWLDLSDGPVHGGEMLTMTSGITWHLNMELKLFADYVFAHVSDGPQRGDVNVFQVRIEIGI